MVDENLLDKHDDSLLFEQFDFLVHPSTTMRRAMTGYFNISLHPTRANCASIVCHNTTDFTVTEKVDLLLGTRRMPLNDHHSIGVGE